MQQLQWQKGQDREELARNLAAHVAGLLTEQLARKEQVSLAVSGGSTPSLFFQYLSRCQLPWQRVSVVPVDERWVESGSDQANESLIRSHLLQGEAARAYFVSLLGQGDDPHEAVQWANERLAGTVMPLTLAIMGMGADGHTASWFPGDPASDQALSDDTESGYCLTRASSPPHTRLTLSWPCIRDAVHCLLHIHGEDKRRVLEAVLAVDNEPQLPVRRLFERPLSVFWSP